MNKILTRVLAVIVIALASQATSFAEDRALVVGINVYPKMPDKTLLGAASDASRFAKFLTDVFAFGNSQIKVMTDREATREGILKAFRDWLIEGTKPGDRAIFYFSGHGLRLFKDGMFMNAFAPSDLERGSVGGKIEFDNAIFSDELTGLRHELAGRNVLFVFDSCYSGKIARNANESANSESGIRVKSVTPDSVGTIRGELPQGRSRHADVQSAGGTGEFALWAAVAPNQLALEDVLGGVFTSALIAGVRERAADSNKDGKIQVSELFNFVSEVSRTFCDRHKGNCLAGLDPDLTADPDEMYRTGVFWPRTYVEKPDAPVELMQAVFQHKNDFDLSLELYPGNVVPYDSHMFFRVRSASSGQLLIFDQRADGSFHLIFPNRMSLDRGASRIVPARDRVEVPRDQDSFRYTAKERGKSVAMAVVIADDIKIDDITAQFQRDEAITNPQKLVGVLAARLQAPLVDKRPDVPDRRVKWAFSLIEYEVR